MSLMVDIEKRCHKFILRVKFNCATGITGILGASGCGKSMTLKCIAGIETPDKGKIILNGTTLFDSDERINLPIRQRNIGYLFQNYALFPHMSVRDNIGIAVRDKQVRQQRIDYYLQMFELIDFADYYPKQLSGGQQQRVALARILASDPEILMLDEPFSALDDFLKWKVELELRQLLAGYDKNILFVSHNRDEIYRFCDNIIVLDAGQQVSHTDKLTLFARPETLAAAKLSGCKNYSRIIVDEEGIHALDWNITLPTALKVSEFITHIGIRAHDIQLADKNLCPADRLYAFKITDIIDDLFSLNIMGSFPGANEALRIEIAKPIAKHIPSLTKGSTIYLVLPIDKILLLS